MFLKSLRATSPTSIDSTWKIRRHIATAAYMFLDNLWETSPASIESTWKMRRQVPWVLGPLGSLGPGPDQVPSHTQNSRTFLIAHSSILNPNACTCIYTHTTAMTRTSAGHDPGLT